MFKPLGLFLSSPCPDPSCHRPKCLFSHGESSQQGSTSSQSRPSATKSGGSKAGPSANGTKHERRDSNVPEKRQKKEEGSNGVIPGVTVKPTPSVAKRVSEVNGEASGKGSPASLIAKSTVSPAPRLPPPAPIVRKPPAPVVINPLRPPSIPLNIKLSPQPYADRQKALLTLFQQFTKLYQPLLRSHPEIAHTSALAQEKDVSAASSNLKQYKSAIHHAAVSISRRQPPDSVTHPSVGTVKECRAAYEKLEKDLASRLTRSKVSQYCLPLDQFAFWAYPDPTNPELINGGGTVPDLEGTSRDCSRCKKPFVVSSKDLEKRMGECKFHHGKIQPERIEGRRKWIYSCCKRERGEVGCEDGVHVFTDKDDDKALNDRVGYKTVKQVWEAKKGVDTSPKGKSETREMKRRVVDVAAMDCEMIYTTAGSSLARVTVIDENGETLLDERVRQHVPILDINTRFSGLKPGDLDDAIMDLEAVRAAVCVFIGPETIIVGHGLENDLRALRLLHDKVIDTAILFPHDKGAPYRRALRDIVKEKLGVFIQERTGDFGHSSAEDAKATLEVLKWKVREDAK